MIWLIVLIFIAVAIVFVMHFRRQARAREAASAERMKAFLDQARAANSGAHGGAGANAGTSTPSVAPAAPAPAAARETKLEPMQTASGIRLRAPALSAPQQAAYRLLKNALVGQEVLAQVSLAAMVAPSDDVTGFAREAALRRLADTQLDFLVCDGAFKPLAAVQCGARTGKAAQDAAYAQSCVISLGMRWVELDPLALPAAEVLRQRVLEA